MKQEKSSDSSKRVSIRDVKRAVNKKNKSNKIRAQLAFDLPLKSF